MAAGVVAVVLVPGALNKPPLGWVLGVALDDVEVSPGLAVRPENRLGVLPIFGH